MDLTRELEAACDLAQRAGTMALSLRGKLKISHKPNGEGPVTNADIAIDEFVCKELLKKFPNDKIISEEGLRPDNLNVCGKRIWFIDPIDGTSSYIMGDDDFVIMIGLAIDKVAQLGVVLQPTKNIMWSGIVDLNQAEKKSCDKIEPLIVQQQNPPSTLKVIASRTHRSQKQDAMVAALNPAQLLYRSSIGLKAMLIAEGIADLYVAWSRRIKLWDTCAPAAIMKACGAHVSFVDENQLSYNGSINHGAPVVFANFTPNKELFTLLREINNPFSL